MHFEFKYLNGYPNYLKWLHEIAKQDLLFGYKKAVLTLSDNQLIGSLMFQPDKYNPQFLEIKNIRCVNKFQRRLIAMFMLRQAVKENEGLYQGIKCDAPAEKRDVASLLLKEGFRIIGNEFLYTGHRLDNLFFKPLR